MRKEYYICFGSVDEINKLPAQKITHLIYSFLFATRKGNLTCRIGENPCDGSSLLLDEETANRLEAMGNLKKANPDLKVKFAIGGGGVDKDPEKHQEEIIRELMQPENSMLLDRFVGAIASVIEAHNLDGVDIDFEHPRYNSDIDGLIEFCKKLRIALDRIRPDLEISMAVAGNPEQAVLYNYGRKELEKYVGMWNIMNYDYDYGTPHVMYFNAPFERENNSSVYSTKEAVEDFLAKGFSASKINLGVPFYGRRFTVDGNVKTVLFGETCFNERFDMEYNNIPSEVLSGTMGYEKIWDEKAKSFYSVKKNDEGFVTEVYTYDDVESLQYKSKYAHELGLAGIMVWQICQDTPEWKLMDSI